ncbi:MAG: type II and III secretion system protein family protein [Rhizobiaceae bacterium]|nr:type II and III secretion system protein family protein [Rhizobiaceae bacterium]
MLKLSKSFLKAASVAAILSVSQVMAGTVTVAHAENFLKISKSAIGKTQTVKVGLNKSMVIDLPGDAHDILVANPDVADAITRTSRRIYIFAKQVGSTNIFIFDSKGQQLLSIDLNIERDIAGLEENLRKYIPGSDIKVEIVNDNIILTGSVPTPQASARVVQLARAFVTGGEATTNQFNQNFSGDVSNGGTVIEDNEERRESQIVNLLRIEGEDQVHLKVTVAEIQRTVVKQLGIDLTAVGLTAGNIALGAFGDNPFGLRGIGSNSAIGAQYDGGGTETIQGMLRALNQSGVIRTLAEPSLTAISGETATFSVGGQYSVLREAELGGNPRPFIPNFDIDETRTNLLNLGQPIGSVSRTFEQIEYGIGLSFSPVVLGPGRISLRIRTEVSEPTTEGAITVGRAGPGGSITIPGLRRREAETTVELPSGGSMVLAGLLKDDVRQTSAGFPGLKDVPVLGTLFRSRQYQRYETELVVIATPYLVRPIARQQLARPDDNFQPSADGAANFLGRVNRVYGKVEGQLPEGRYHGKVGFIFK